MWVMAIRAGNLAFQDGVMRGAVDLGTFVLVAGKADFKLGRFAQQAMSRLSWVLPAQCDRFESLL
jgi:hypothetical protein